MEALQPFEQLFERLFCVVARDSLHRENSDRYSLFGPGIRQVAELDGVQIGLQGPCDIAIVKTGVTVDVIKPSQHGRMLYIAKHNGPEGPCHNHCRIPSRESLICR